MREKENAQSMLASLALASMFAVRNFVVDQTKLAEHVSMTPMYWMPFENAVVVVAAAATPSTRRKTGTNAEVAVAAALNNSVG
jgi:hypothetical protein